MRGIDPKWAALLSALITFELAIGHGTVSLTHAVPAEWIPAVQAWCNIAAVGGTALSTILSLYSSNATGIMISSSIPTSTVIKVFIVGLTASLLFLPTPSRADALTNVKADLAKIGIKPIPTLKVTKTATAPAQTSPILTLDQLMSKIEQITATVVSNTITDIQAANADASTVITPAVVATSTTPAVPAVLRDPIAAACYPALIQFLQSMPTSTPTTGTFIAVQLFQKQRDFVAQVQAGLPTYLKLGCAALLGDEVQIFTAVLGMVGITVGTGGLAGILPATTLLPAIPALVIP